MIFREAIYETDTIVISLVGTPGTSVHPSEMIMPPPTFDSYQLTIGDNPTVVLDLNGINALWQALNCALNVTSLSQV